MKVDRLVAWLEGTPFARAAWLVDGVPYAVLVPLAVALPFAASGPLRAILDWPLWAALAPALVLSLVVLTPVWQSLRARPRTAPPLTVLALPIIPALFSIAVLYNRHFAGLTNYAGGDGGVHVALKDVFVHEAYNAYQGFVSMYALMYWIEAVARCNVFWSMCAVYYLGVAFVAALPVIVGLAVLAPFDADRRAWRAGAAVLVVASLAAAWWVVLPQQHYHQTDGFFPHLFGLIPLGFVWLIDTCVRARLWRWSGLLLGVAFYRYTYGLNLGDILLALGVLLFADSFGRGVPLVPRWLLRLAPLPLLFGARLVYVSLEPLLTHFGWFVPYDIPTVQWAQAFAVVALGVALGGLARLPGDDGRVFRALRFPLVFSVMTGIVTQLAFALPPREPYYLLKYPIHAVVLAASALVVVAALVTARIVDGVQCRRWLAPAGFGFLSMAAVIAASVGWTRTYEPFQPTFRERVFGKPPFTYNRPLGDVAAWLRIERTLARENKKFGGYLTSYWPMFNFMNAGLGYYNGGREFWVQARPCARPAIASSGTTARSTGGRSRAIYRRACAPCATRSTRATIARA